MADRCTLGWSLASLLLAACSDETASGGSETGATQDAGESEDTGSLEDDDLCVTVLDPEVYQSPAWTPEVLAGDEECPALEGPLNLALPASVPVTGIVRLGGVPSEATLRLVRRSDESDVRPDVAADGSFEALVLPGRYDVHVGMPKGMLGHSTLALEDIDLSAAIELMVDGPAPITISGALTLDGQPPPDPFGYIIVRPASINAPPELLVHMELQSYEITVGPGTYDFSYTWCDYSDPPGVHVSWICIEQGDLSDIPADTPKLSPVQFDVALLDEVTFEADTTFDIDVPTATISGTVRVDGAPPISDEVVLLRRGGEVGLYDEGLWFNEGFSGEPDEDGDWGGRVVAGHYDVHFGLRSGPVHESLLVDHDMSVDVELETVLLTGAFPTESPISSYQGQEGLGAFGFHLQALDDIGKLEIPYDVPPEFEQRIYPGRYEITHWAQWCWPDYLGSPNPVGSPIIAHDLDIQESLELEVSLASARVSFDIRETGPQAFPLRLQPIGEPPSARYGIPLDLSNGELVAHGVVVPGRYQLLYGTYTDVPLGEIDIVDGTSVHAQLESAAVTMTLSLGGQPVDPTGFVRLRAENGDSVGTYDEGLVVPPGRYRLSFLPKSNEDALPQNREADLGCVTIGSRS